MNKKMFQLSSPYKIILQFIFLVLIIVFTFSCGSSSKFKKDKTAFESSKVIMSFKSVADMNDSYFVIKENNFIEFYKILYDSVKNTRYPGKYTQNGDTLLLNFYNAKGYALLGYKALVDKNKKEIVFFDNYPGFKKRLLIN
ncbi:MAG: hypothetical protein WKF35_13875 [Ferruginibacter sp.]